MGRLIAGHPLIGWAPACAGVTESDPRNYILPKLAKVACGLLRIRLYLLHCKQIEMLNIVDSNT